MNALLAAYMALSYIPTDSGPQLLPGYHHSPIVAKVDTGDCSTAWGRDYAVGERLSLGGIALECQYVSTWRDGRYQGNSVRCRHAINPAYGGAAARSLRRCRDAR